MRCWWIFSVLVLLSGDLRPATAGDVGFSGGVGTLGTEVTVAARLSPYFDALVGYQQLDFDTTLTDDDRNSFDIDMEMTAPRLGVQYYPFPGLGIGLEAGMVFGAPEIAVDAKADAASRFTVGPQTYFTNQIGTLTGTARFEDDNAPYLLLNVGRSTASGFNVNLSLGAVSYGAAKVTLKNSQCALETNPVANAAACGLLKLHLIEEEAEVNKDLEDYELWPLVRLAVSYSF